MKTYQPRPIDISDIELDTELNELREAIAENAHDIWAQDRLLQGWKYGPVRNDEALETPCMVPYSELSDEDKEIDRSMAIKTLKLLYKLGYDIVKRENTELYRELLKRIRTSNTKFYCPECYSKGIITPLYLHQVFCDRCGKKLSIDWKVTLE